MEIGDPGEESVEGEQTCQALGEAGSSVNKMLYSNGSPIDTQDLLNELSAAEKSFETQKKRKKLGSTTRSTRSKRIKRAGCDSKCGD